MRGTTHPVPTHLAPAASATTVESSSVVLPITDRPQVQAKPPLREQRHLPTAISCFFGAIKRPIQTSVHQASSRPLTAERMSTSLRSVGYKQASWCSSELG